MAVGNALRTIKQTSSVPQGSGRVAILLRLAKAICELRLEGWDQDVPATVKQAAEVHFNIKIKKG